MERGELFKQTLSSKQRKNIHFKASKLLSISMHIQIIEHRMCERHKLLIIDKLKQHLDFHSTQGERFPDLLHHLGLGDQPGLGLGSLFLGFFL